MKPRAVKVVVLGGGFGGLYAASYLGRSELREYGAKITLVDRKNYFTFTPLLSEVAAGTLGREHVTYPYRAMARRYGFGFVQDAAWGIDLERQVVQTEHAELQYDYLVLAVGGEPQYFNNENIENGSVPFASVDDALAVRGRVIGALERAMLVSDDDERRRLLTFVIAGAGPAGVEVASEISNLANHLLRSYYRIPTPVRVVLAEGGNRILAGFDEALARAGLERLRERGIEVRLQTRIEDLAPGVVTARGTDGSERIPAHTLIWTAGSAPVRWISALPIPTERAAVKIDHLLRVAGCENVFAVGDVTTLTDERTGRPYPKVAPIAISQGIRAAANIENHVLGRDLEPYQAFHAGKIVALGCGVALVDLLGWRISGPLAWWIYRATYLLKLVGTKNKIRVLVTLALNRVFEPDITYETSGLSE